MKTAALLLLLLGATAPLVATAEGPVTYMAAGSPVTVVATDPWDVIKDYTFQQRAAFLSGAEHLNQDLGNRMQKLREKRATLPETSTKDWDFAMKELIEAQAYLKFAISSAPEATYETWSEAKDKIADAWQRANSACDKVKASTTS